MIQRLILILLLLLGMVPEAHGAPVKIQVIHLEGPHGLDPTEAFVAAEEAAKFIRAKTGVDARISVFKTQPDPSAHLNTFDLMVRRLDLLGGIFTRSGDIKKTYITHFVLPPAWYGEKLIMGGWAKRVCAVGAPRGNFSYSNAMFFNPLILERPYRFTASIAAIAHEMMHVLGASHVESQTIMHPGALSFSINSLPEVDEVSIRQIKRCVTFAQRRQRNAN